MTRLERTIGAVLRAGVTVSTTCFLLGLVLTFTGIDMLADTLLHLCIVVLLATPVARVLVSTLDYAKQRDWTFVALTLIVLVELMAGAFAALR
jgi:uncharacterized membrane protein